MQAVTPSEFRAVRNHLRLSEADFAAELGYGGSERNRKVLILQYERGKKQPIPSYIARLAYLIAEHFDVEDGHLPEWPESCAHNPPKPNGDKR